MTIPHIGKKRSPRNEKFPVVKVVRSINFMHILKIDWDEVNIDPPPLLTQPLSWAREKPAGGLT